ncbi:MAG: histidine phosphatase family protein [Acidimicrobiia bacterium]|nr:histidine phosphatase family protein [Acidimicrobiia bacterium]
MTERPAVPTTPSTPTAPAEPPSPPPPPTALDRAFLSDVDGVTHVVLVRHGEQDVPGDPRRASPAEWIDPPLSELGRRQAEAVGVGLSTERIDHVYASPLQRAADTAAQIAGRLGLEVAIVPELREIELFRDLPEGTSLLDAVDPLLLRGARERFARERRWDVYPFSETGDELRHRVLMAIEGIIATHPGSTVLIACHGGVINTYLGAVLGLVGEDMFFRPHHASVHRIVAHGDRRIVRSLNEVHHLRAVDPALVTW